MDELMPANCLRHEIQMNRFCYTCSYWFCYHCRGDHLQHTTQDLRIIISLNELLKQLRLTYCGTYYDKVKIAMEMLYEYYKFYIVQEEYDYAPGIYRMSHMSRIMNPD